MQYLMGPQGVSPILQMAYVHSTQTTSQPQIIAAFLALIFNGKERLIWHNVYCKT